ncbi:hypothetical protein K0M31_004600 [Melipona bicolor]|uniref:MRN complex-interacting protein N-terminal domain-containing protein n=1 Tax=Melipona bicolor TaxID=60889 RepID=A0AA40FXT5_9HYME|nr:hypothetical protein K0M31_004600 [Melipona bicolor]
MSQEMNILRCYSCKTYQVHIVKKAKKWQCKICNFKQTFKQAYFKGSGKDCRIVVQKLNLMKEHENQENVSFNSNSSNHNYTNDYTKQPKSNVNVENKWAKYLDKSEEIKSDIFKASSSKDNSQIGTDHLENNNTICDWSQNKHTNIDKDVSYEKDFEQDFIYDNEQEYDNFVSEEMDNVSDSDNNSKSNHSKNVNEIKSTKNIFDDNEDFDITIDF